MKKKIVRVKKMNEENIFDKLFGSSLVVKECSVVVEDFVKAGEMFYVKESDSLFKLSRRDPNESFKNLDNEELDTCDSGKVKNTPKRLYKD